MTNFSWWADQAPAGSFMCCLCFENRPVDEARRNAQGDREDVCIPCDEDEQRELERRRRVSY